MEELLNPSSVQGTYLPRLVWGALSCMRAVLTILYPLGMFLFVQNVYIESHIYMWFDPSLAGSSIDELTQKACTGYYKQQLDNADNIGSGVVVGEWSMDAKR